MFLVMVMFAPAQGFHLEPRGTGCAAQDLTWSCIGLTLTLTLTLCTALFVALFPSICRQPATQHPAFRGEVQHRATSLSAWLKVHTCLLPFSIIITDIVLQQQTEIYTVPPLLKPIIPGWKRAKPG